MMMVARVEKPKPPKNKRGLKRSEGSYRLARLGLTNKRIADDLEIEPSTVGRWIGAETRPTPKQREEIAALYRIEAGAWEVPRVNALEPKAKARQDGKARTAGEILREILAEKLEELRTRTGDFAAATPKEQVAMLQTVAGLYFQVQTSLDEREQLAMLIGLSAWARMKRTLLEALRGHPEAAGAVVEALRSAELGG